MADDYDIYPLSDEELVIISTYRQFGVPTTQARLASELIDRREESRLAIKAMNEIVDELKVCREILKNNRKYVFKEGVAVTRSRLKEICYSEGVISTDEDFERLMVGFGIRAAEAGATADEVLAETSEEAARHWVRFIVQHTRRMTS